MYEKYEDKSAKNVHTNGDKDTKVTKPADNRSDVTVLCKTTESSRGRSKSQQLAEWAVNRQRAAV